MQDLIGYDRIIKESMYSVVAKVLKKIEQNGLQGNHHFVITFATNFFGVKLTEQLLQKYPKTMTIVLQHQFKDLRVGEADFSVALSFYGVSQDLIIPYHSLILFSDPSVDFALNFDPESLEKDEINRQEEENYISDHTMISEAKIISFDDFRKNNKP